MQWLSRSSSKHRSDLSPGVLGAGATVVRTPEDALRDTRVRCSPHEAPHIPPPRKPDANFSPPQSPPLPPLPPLPAPAEDESKPSRLPPDEHQDLAQAPAYSQEELPFPPIAFGVRSTSPPPPFRPILLSELPAGDVDPINTIITLQTSTETYKTSLDTLMSQHSVLTEYITSLLSRSRTYSNASSLYLTDGGNSNIAGNFSSPCRIDIFLDRPSPPYVHILAYLRSSSGPKPSTATLPMKVQLVHNYTQERLENLLELRDEAAFLKLAELQKLCEDELRSRQGTVLFDRHSHDSDTLGSIHSQHASVYSIHTLIDRVEVQTNSCLSTTSITKTHRRPESKDSKHEEVHGTKQILTPEFRTGSRGGSAGGQCSPPRPYPAGWI
ncbi:hypothetical protein APHAL10511_001898 [Amanita phalloides]|nr:hypothetical protein APHAL10511_001898 [Amanita phalloides]